MEDVLGGEFCPTGVEWEGITVLSIDSKVSFVYSPAAEVSLDLISISGIELSRDLSGAMLERSSAIELSLALRSDFVRCPV
jgi:hypothetical protein